MDSPTAALPTQAGSHHEALRGSTRPATLANAQGEHSLPSPRTHFAGLGRHTLGILLLLTTVVLWTASQFLASTIFADNTYSKPYFVTYVNSTFFILLLLPVLLQRLLDAKGSWRHLIRKGHKETKYALLAEDEQNTSAKADSEGDPIVYNGHMNGGSSPNNGMASTGPTEGAAVKGAEDRLTIRDTAWLSLEFSILWFIANYFVAACLNYTSVASSTILTSTSSIWTLLIGASLGVENFTLKKLIGVIASFAGILLISSVDISGDNDKNRGSFPHKSSHQITIGDALALLSAVLYGR
ncbi:MAG: hypothetical protein Q9186_000256 [Xanthomendoza sp. 1 TL-2023]